MKPFAQIERKQQGTSTDWREHSMALQQGLANMPQIMELKQLKLKMHADISLQQFWKP